MKEKPRLHIQEALSQHICLTQLGKKVKCSKKYFVFLSGAEDEFSHGTLHWAQSRKHLWRVLLSIYLLQLVLQSAEQVMRHVSHGIWWYCNWGLIWSGACTLDSSAWAKGSEPGKGNFNKGLWNHCWNAQSVLICGFSETLLNQMLFRESWPPLQCEHAALRPYPQAGSQHSRPWTYGEGTLRREVWQSQTTPATTSLPMCSGLKL